MCLGCASYYHGHRFAVDDCRMVFCVVVAVVVMAFLYSHFKISILFGSPYIFWYDGKKQQTIGCCRKQLFM